MAQMGRPRPGAPAVSSKDKLDYFKDNIQTQEDQARARGRRARALPRRATPPRALGRARCPRRRGARAAARATAPGDKHPARARSRLVLFLNARARAAL